MARGKAPKKVDQDKRKRVQKTAKESRQRLVNQFREDTRDKFFKGNENISDDRLDRRRQQDLAEQRFIRTRMKPVIGSSDLLQKRDPEGIDLAEFRRRNAMQYGPTLSEIGSDIGYGLSSIAKGFAEKGTPMMQLLKGLYDKGKDFVTQGIPNALRGESQFVVPRPDPFSSGADAIEGAFVGPTFNDQKINIQSLDSVFPLPPSKMSNEQFDEEFPFLPERTVNLDNPLFKQQNFQPIRVSDMDMTGVTAQEGDRPVLPENVIPMMRVGEPMNIDQYKTPVLPPEVTDPRMYQGQTLYAQNFGLPSLKQSYDFLRNPQVETPLGNLRFDNFLSGNPQLGYGNTVMINGVPVDLSATIGQDQISGGLSFAFKKGGSVDKHSGLGYKLK